MIKKAYYIRDVAEKSGVKASTIRFYESVGFLEPVERLKNGYRVFNEHHIFQVRVCSLVFGGFINSRLRRISMRVIDAARSWDQAAYEYAAMHYRQSVQQELIRAGQAVNAAIKQQEPAVGEERILSKKEASELLGVTPETIRGWERSGLLRRQRPYSRRMYDSAEISRMFLIRFLLDVGYSCMAILRFLTAYDAGDAESAAGLLRGDIDDEELSSRADRYLQALETAERQAEELCGMLQEMKTIKTF